MWWLASASLSYMPVACVQRAHNNQECCCRPAAFSALCMPMTTRVAAVDRVVW